MLDRVTGRGIFGITVFLQVGGALALGITEILIWYYGNTKGEIMPYKPTGRRVGRPEKEDTFKPVSVKLPPDLLERVKQYSVIHQQSLSELIRSGLEWRISEGDVWYLRNSEISSTPQPDSGNTVILKEVKLLVNRLAVVVGASVAPAAQGIRGEPDEGNTVLQEMAKPVYMVDESIAIDENLAASPEMKTQPLPDISNYHNTVLEEYDNTVIQKKGSKRPGRPSTMREPILSLLREHPEGLGTEQIRGYLNPEKPIGDTLQGLRRGALVRTKGSGREMRYFLAGEP